MTSEPLPWEVPGRPFGLTEDHFRLAADVWAMHEEARVGEDRLRPALGVWGHYANCAGNQYEHNRERTRRLIRYAPLHTSRDGALVHPAVLAPDPSMGHNDAQPLAVITIEGYVGSAWTSLATELAPAVGRGFRPDASGGRLLFVTVLRVSADSEDVEVWLPLRESRKPRTTR